MGARAKTTSTRATSRQATRIFRTAWGWVGLSASARGIRTVVLPKTSRREVEQALSEEAPSANGTLSPFAPYPLPETAPVLRTAQSQIAAYLAGKRRDVDVPIDLSGGSAFQRRVWQVIRRIPYGRVRSYKWVASRVGGARYARAVGLALGANPVPLVIPCHRVVTSDGSLGGFTGGVYLKRRLLALEGALARQSRARGERL
jgi:methylated-DNA-[protein]-cysteine S-methyltransferase